MLPRPIITATDPRPPTGSGHGVVPGSLHAALAAGPIMLDGGLATELEAQGHDLSSALWSARLLTDDPEAIVAAHLAYFDAGAQVAITASYQAPLELIGVQRPAGPAGQRSPRTSGSVDRRLGRSVRREPGRRLGVSRPLRRLRRRAAGLAPAADRSAGRGGRRPARAGNRAVPGRSRGAARRARRHRASRLVVDHLCRGPDASRRAGGGGVRHGPRRRRGARSRRQLHRSAGRHRPHPDCRGRQRQAGRGLPQQRGELGCGRAVAGSASRPSTSRTSSSGSTTGPG